MARGGSRYDVEMAPQNTQGVWGRHVTRRHLFQRSPAVFIGAGSFLPPAASFHRPPPKPLPFRVWGCRPQCPPLCVRAPEKTGFWKGCPSRAEPKFQDVRADVQRVSGALGEASPSSSLFDHSPMAPPIVHPVKVSITAGYVLGPGTLEKGGYGLSRPGGNLGFRLEA